MLKIYPVKIQCYDEEMDEVMFNVETFDAECCTVEIKTVVDADSWPELSELILKSLIAARDGVG
jgi:hypothetical protein